MDYEQTRCEYFDYITSVDLKQWKNVKKMTGEFFWEKNKCSVKLLTFCSAKSILHLRGEQMSNMGRPEGKNNKEYVYSIRMDELNIPVLVPILSGD